MFLFGFIIAVLSGSVGLTKLVDSSYPQWMGLIMSILLLIIWRPASVTIKKINRLRIESIKLNGVITMTILAVLVPVVFEVLLKKGVGIPEAPLDPTVYLVTAVILMLVTTLDALFIGKEACRYARSQDGSFRIHGQLAGECASERHIYKL